MSKESQQSSRISERISRRNMMRVIGAGAAAMAIPSYAADAKRKKSDAKRTKPAEKKRARRFKSAAKKGNINQSIVYWCFAEHWDVEKTCQVAKQLGCKSVELVAPSDWPTLKKHGLTCAIAPNGMADPPFVKGFCNPKYHGQLIATTKKTVDSCAEFGVKTVIAFTGSKWRNAEDPNSGEISLEEGADNCVKGLKELCRYAEQKKVNVAMEILNTRATDHPMKGHAGYQGDHTDYCMEIVKKVGSPRMKLLFDIYHVQIMDGDIISRIRQYADYIGHYHTAGNPGRCEIGPKQEINYRAIMQEIVKTGYKGYVGQEFIPTIDPLKGLKQAVQICDV